MFESKNVLSLCRTEVHILASFAQVMSWKSWPGNKATDCIHCINMHICIQLSMIKQKNGLTFLENGPEQEPLNPTERSYVDHFWVSLK